MRRVALRKMWSPKPLPFRGRKQVGPFPSEYDSTGSAGNPPAEPATFHPAFPGPGGEGPKGSSWRPAQPALPLR